MVNNYHYTMSCLFGCVQVEGGCSAQISTSLYEEFNTIKEIITYLFFKQKILTNFFHSFILQNLDQCSQLYICQVHSWEHAHILKQIRYFPSIFNINLSAIKSQEFFIYLLTFPTLTAAFKVIFEPV
jgi:hypothetical protein